MGYDYLLFHVYFTIPPALALTVLFRPLVTRLDKYMILVLITIAVVSTTPWDSYLIHRGIWNYPPTVILGPTLFAIPLEEVFFFIIQTYITSVLYLIISKPTLHAAYLHSNARRDASSHLPGTLFVCTLGLGLAMISGSIFSMKTMYMGLILSWVSPFLLFIWCFSPSSFIRLPLSNTLLPIMLSTLYLWVADTVSLSRGTWSISDETKLGLYLWHGLEIEEAVFFLVTNILIVFALAAFHSALAILHALPEQFPDVPATLSPRLLMQALIVSFSERDRERVADIADAESRLRSKSRSFHLASGTFSGRLRVDLISLYSFCRVVDDLVDEALGETDTKRVISLLHTFLRKTDPPSDNENTLKDFYEAQFPRKAWSALRILPTPLLSRQPLFDLLKGFEMDAEFPDSDNLARQGQSPIKSEVDLDTYGYRVAGTVAHLCLDLIFHHTRAEMAQQLRLEVYRAAERMGVALQIVNISRDISRDARLGRCYLPLDWLKEEDLTAAAVIANPQGPKITQLRLRLLEKAFRIYDGAKSAIDALPIEARGPIRVAVESYMEIGRVQLEGRHEVEEDSATVPTWRRLKVAWRALNDW